MRIDPGVRLAALRLQQALLDQGWDLTELKPYENPLEPKGGMSVYAYRGDYRYVVLVAIYTDSERMKVEPRYSRQHLYPKQFVSLESILVQAEGKLDDIMKFEDAQQHV